MVESCSVNPPDVLPLMTNRKKLEGLCVKIVLKSSAGSEFGGGIDLKCVSSDLANAFNSTLNTLVTHAMAVSDSIRDLSKM